VEYRDPKGLYKKARKGEIRGFTGIDDPYEPPTQCELILKTVEHNAEVLASQVVELLRARGVIGLTA